MADLCRFKLLAFFSVDIIGSTPAKAHQRQPSPPSWASWLKQFFVEFPKQVVAQYPDDPGEREYVDPCHRLRVWKLNGDEVLLFAELTHHSQIVDHILAVRAAIDVYAPSLARKAGECNNVSIWLKATAWLAGFPVTNVEVVVPDAIEGGQEVRDYIGPSIDLGFRLTKLATRRRFVLSADLAHMLLSALPAHQSKHADHSPGGEGGRYRELVIGYDGAEPLRGVLGGVPYPVVYVQMADRYADMEDDVLARPTRHTPSGLLELLTHYLKSTPGLRLPFVYGDDGYGTGAGDLEDALALIVEEERRLAVEAEASDSDDGEDAKLEVDERLLDGVDQANMSPT